MPSPAYSDPRAERPANDELGDLGAGRCPVCHAPLIPTAKGRKKKFCGPRCKQFAWRRNGEPDGRLDWQRAAR